MVGVAKGQARFGHGQPIVWVNGTRAFCGNLAPRVEGSECHTVISTVFRQQVGPFILKQRYLFCTLTPTIAGLGHSPPRHSSKLGYSSQAAARQCTPSAACDVQAGGMLLHKSILTTAGGLRRAAGMSTCTHQPASHRCCSPAITRPLCPCVCVCVCRPTPALRRCAGGHAVARSSSMTSSGVTMLVSTAAASSNGRFAGSSAAELEEWLVGQADGLIISRNQSP